MTSCDESILISFYKQLNKFYKYLLLRLVISALVVAAAGCSSSVRFASESLWETNIGSDEESGEFRFTGRQFSGKASYYANKFNGRTTASGAVFDNNKITAAHKTLPFGTIVKVTNRRNNKSVIVEINDRGPFVSGRIIDLSRDAAVKLDMISAGVVEVIVRVAE